MRLKIPLCWFGRQVYDITMDEVRGGWLWLGIRIRWKRTFRREYQLTVQWWVGL